ncbi:UNKNOWN [Stylonychia lemnae]|uniref:TLDc domain-containing protein n=1 Tax=Stylonychia lemnae TaxID=5949 RepID=A0A078A3T9_STYLE|nr:UNKNOWN [Stylonychia lemnae]|eukprot:CDW75419.1 UNKNOWN [Stylonychia lemnae]
MCNRKEKEDLVKEGMNLPNELTFKVAQYLMRELERQEILCIKCDQHNDHNAKSYCKVEDTIICSECILHDGSHYHSGSTENPQHIKIERAFFKEVFQSQVKQLEQQQQKIQNLIVKFKGYIDQERDYKVQEIKEMLANNSQILQYASDNPIIRQKFGQSSNILDYLTTFSLKQEEEQKENLKKRQQLIDAIPTKISKEYYEPYLKFRRLVDEQHKQQSVELIFKGSRDGFRSKNFHAHCDSKGHTVSFILSSFGEVFGGYTSIPWTSEKNYLKDSQAFLFSLTKQSLHRQHQPTDRAVYHHENHLVTFGYGYDIFIQDQCDTSK